MQSGGSLLADFKVVWEFLFTSFLVYLVLIKARSVSGENMKRQDLTGKTKAAGPIVFIAPTTQSVQILPLRLHPPSRRRAERAPERQKRRKLRSSFTLSAAGGDTKTAEITGNFAAAEYPAKRKSQAENFQNNTASDRMELSGRGAMIKLLFG